MSDSPPSSELEGDLPCDDQIVSDVGSDGTAGVQHALHSGLNGHVNALPDELLALVFMECLAAHQAEFIETQDTFKPYAYIRVAHVCRRWRRVALQHTLLWNEITVLSHQECVDTMVARSKDTPLEIKALVLQDRIIKALKLIKSARDRVQALDLVVTANAFAEVLTHIAAPFPKLRSLQLAASSDKAESRRVNNLPFSTSLVESNWPVLRSLSLHGFDVTCIYEQVLGLERFCVQGPCTLDVKALLHLPQLQSLDLFVVNLSDSQLPERHIQLPMLEEIFIHHNISTIDYYLDAIYCPKVPFIQISCLPNRHIHRNLSLLSKKLASKLDPLCHMDPPHAILTLVFVIRLQGGLMRADAFTTDEVFDEKRKHQFSVSLDGEYNDNSDLGRHMMLFTLPLPLDDVRTLWLGVTSDDNLGGAPMLSTPTESGHFVYAFRRMTRLHTLVLGEFTMDFIEAFLSSNPRSVGIAFVPDNESENKGLPTPEPLLFPSLRHLTLKRVNFNPRYPPRNQGRRPFPFPPRHKAVDTLLLLLERRKARGGGITHLRLHNCTAVTEEVLEKLRLAVEHVQVTKETRKFFPKGDFEDINEAWWTFDNMSSDAKDDMFSTPLWTTE